jgi:predicted transcriptional regulator
MKKKATVQDRVVKLLKGRKRGLTPTEIGLKLGYEKKSASAMVGPALRRMLEAQLVTRSFVGGRTEYVWV